MQKKIIIAIVFMCIVLLFVGIFLIEYNTPDLPGVPTDFTATVMSGTHIDLKWTKGDNADTTYIERNSVSSWSRGEGTLIYNDSGVSYLDTGLSQDSHYYQAWSWNQTDHVFSPTFTTVDNTTFTNQPPIFTLPSPVNGSTNNLLNLTWNILINDPEGNIFTWSIQCSNRQVNSGSGASNGTKSLVLSGLKNSTTYKIWVNATDPGGSGLYTRRWYIFTTKSGLVNNPPVFGVPSPANGSTGNLLSLNWSIPINDLEGNIFTWSIQCSNRQVNSGSGASNGTKSLVLSGLKNSTTYKIWVNATDPGGSGLYTRKWYTFTTKGNLPPVFGTPSPANGSTGNLLSFTLSIPVSDPDSNAFSWSVQCSNGQTNNASGASNGTKFLVLSGLTSSTVYKVWLNATDPGGSGLYTRRWYIFTTKSGLVNNPPVFGVPSPANGSTGNLLSLNWSIPINDLEGNIFTWSIQCSNRQVNSGSGASNGTKSLVLSGLKNSTTYKIWVNATDPGGSGLYTRRWYIFTTKSGLVNNPPVFGVPSPANGSTGNLLSLNWSIPINDLEGNIFTWSIQCSNRQVNSGSGASNGTKSLVLSGLKNSTTYKIWVNATDPGGSGLYTRRWYIFTTKSGLVNNPPVFGVPSPANGSTGNLLSLNWSIPINDLEGNIFTWSIQCSNRQVNSGSGASNGTKSLVLSGLKNSTTYKIWVNATDPGGSGLYTRRWYIFTTKSGLVNNPPVFGVPSPANGSTGNLLSLNWSIPINDLEGNIFTWSIQCSNRQVNSGSGASNGTKSLVLSGLKNSTTYKIWVNATDPGGSGLYTRRWYIFTTKSGLVNNPPVFGVPSPANGSTGNLLSLNWSIPINDLEGNIFTWSIQCSNRQVNSGSGASNGTKSLVLSGLTSSTVYKVWLNATDPGGSGLYTRRWYIFTTKSGLVNNPPVFGVPSPANGSTGNLLSFTWSIPISDPEGCDFSWSIHCSNGQVKCGSGASNGTKSLVLSGLTSSTVYKVWLNATDPGGSGLYTRRWYIFTTKSGLVNNPPVFGVPSPANGSTGNLLSFTWSIPISDPEGCDFSWSIHCSNGQVKCGSGASNGTKSLVLSGLTSSTVYKVWLNATDPGGSGLYTRRWYIFTTKSGLVNNPPVFGVPSPANGSTGNLLSLNWSIPINDLEGNIFTWSIQCSNRQVNSGSGASNGTKSLVLSGLTSSTVYKVWLNATDPGGSGLYTRRWYIFTTKSGLVNNPPVFGVPSPANGSTGNLLSLNWSIPINDLEGNIFTWSIQCSNRQVNSGSGASNGTKSLVLSGLKNSTTYKIWVNATDPGGSGLYTRRWYIFTTKSGLVNNPPVFGVPSPANGSTGNLLSLNWSIPINDLEGNIFTWSIQCSNRQVNSGSGASNGTKSLVLSGLTSSTVYKVWLNATDPGGSGLYTRRWYIFTTKSGLVNNPPVFGVPSPANGSTGNLLSLNWSIPINDLEGNIFTWSIQCSNRQVNSGSGASNGTKSLVLSGLTSSTVYKVWLNATDPGGSGLYTRRWYIFTTKSGLVNNPPVFGVPSPANGSTGNLLSLNWSIPINDLEGNIFTWSIQCSNRQVNSGSGASNGTKSLVLSGLKNSTTYKIWVNATDPNGSGIYTRKWYTFTTQKQEKVELSLKMFHIGAVDAEVTNTGETGINNLNWEFVISRNATLNFRDINVDGNGVIASLPVGGVETISSDPIGLKFGRVTVKVTTSKTGVISPTTITAQAFIIGPIIIILPV